MVTGIAKVASSLKQWQLSLEVGARLMNTAKESSEIQGEGLLKLLESAEMVEKAVAPHLGTNIDIRI